MPGNPKLPRHAHHPSSSPAGARWRIRAGSLALHPLSWWGAPFVEHLITRGRLADPTPLTRPLRAADLVRALDAVDSTVVTSAEWAVVRQIRRGPDAHRARAFRAHGRSRGRRRQLACASRCAPRSGPRSWHVLRRRGADAVPRTGGRVSHPYFDTRLKWDPDWYGKKDRIIAGRPSEAYISANFRFGELFFRILDRHWGPSAVQDWLLSDSPYGPDHLSITIGPAVCA